MNLSYESPSFSVLVRLQAIDDQVEQLAVGVGKTLSSVWGGIGGAMKKVRRVAKSGSETAAGCAVYK